MPNRDDLKRQLARAERWAAIMEEHGQAETCHHEAAAGLRARLAALEPQSAPRTAPKEK